MSKKWRPVKLIISFNGDDSDLMLGKRLFSDNLNCVGNYTTFHFTGKHVLLANKEIE
ncbi:hypothetical protein [Sinomicrobium sp. M5D2P17]